MVKQDFTPEELEDPGCLFRRLYKLDPHRIHKKDVRFKLDSSSGKVKYKLKPNIKHREGFEKFLDFVSDESRYETAQTRDDFLEYLIKSPLLQTLKKYGNARGDKKCVDDRNFLQRLIEIWFQKGYYGGDRNLFHHVYFGDLSIDNQGKQKLTGFRSSLVLYHKLQHGGINVKRVTQLQSNLRHRSPLFQFDFELVLNNNQSATSSKQSTILMGLSPELEFTLFTLGSMFDGNESSPPCTLL